MHTLSKYLPVLRALALLSKDRSTQISALCLGEGGEILSTGHNGFPRKVNDAPDSRHERPEKYIWTCHAEENCIANAARSGSRLHGSTMLLYGLPSCSTCSRLIVQAGIARLVVFHCFKSNAKWDEDRPFAEAILREGGVLVEVEELPIGSGEMK